MRRRTGFFCHVVLPEGQDLSCIVTTSHPPAEAAGEGAARWRCSGGEGGASNESLRAATQPNKKNPAHVSAWIGTMPGLGSCAPWENAHRKLLPGANVQDATRAAQLLPARAGAVGKKLRPP